MILGFAHLAINTDKLDELEQFYSSKGYVKTSIFNEVKILKTTSLKENKITPVPTNNSGKIFKLSFIKFIYIKFIFEVIFYIQVLYSEVSLQLFRLSVVCSTYLHKDLSFLKAEYVYLVQ